MALRISLRRRGTRGMDPWLTDEAPAGRADDYIVEEGEPRTPVLVRVLYVAQVVLFAIVAVLSLAVFWLIGLVTGAF